MILVREKITDQIICHCPLNMKLSEYISKLTVAYNKICCCLASICARAGDHYAQLVFRSGNSDSLWSLKAIYSMCEMEQTQVIQI